MPDLKILFSNLGYARGIDGSLWQHLSRAGRHFYCPVAPQQQVLNQVKDLMTEHGPDLCCFVEIDRGSRYSGNFNQMQALQDNAYQFSDITGKYGEGRAIGFAPFMQGKSNGFLARQNFRFHKHYFTCGSKRLIHEIKIRDDLHVFFTHFSLQYKTRKRQFEELCELIAPITGQVIVLADFNIFRGFGELRPLTDHGKLLLINQPDETTFMFHKTRHVLDLCLCSDSLKESLDLKIIPQPYSDHAALLVTIKNANA